MMDLISIMTALADLSPISFEDESGNTRKLSIATPKGFKNDVINRDCPIAVPSPRLAVSSFQMVTESYGPPSKRLQSVQFDLNYDVFLAQLTSDRGLSVHQYNQFSCFSAMVTAINRSDHIGTARRAQLVSLGGFGIIPALSGLEFIGFKVAIRIFDEL